MLIYTTGLSWTACLGTTAGNAALMLLAVDRSSTSESQDTALHSALMLVAEAAVVRRRIVARCAFVGDAESGVVRRDHMLAVGLEACV